MHIIQMAQEQHAIYLGYAFFLGVLGKFYRNRKGLSIFKVIGIIFKTDLPIQ